MRSPGSKFGRPRFSGSPRRLAWLGLAGLLLLLLNYGAPIPAAPEDTPSATNETDWQVEVAQEALARALAKLTDISLEVAREIVRIAGQEAQKYEKGDVFRVLAFIIVESKADSNAVSKAGARGLMQIMPGTGEYIASEREEIWRGKKSLHEIETNIVYGTWYYYYLLALFEGNEQAAVAAYNWGPEHIAWRIREGRRLPRVYPRKVFKAQERLIKEFDKKASCLYRKRLREE